MPKTSKTHTSTSIRHMQPDAGTDIEINQSGACVTAKKHVNTRSILTV